VNFFSEFRLAFDGVDPMAFVGLKCKASSQLGICTCVPFLNQIN